MRRLLFLPLALLAGLFLNKCGQPVAKIEEATKQPNRRDLTRSAMRASVWRFVYCLEEDQDPQQLRAFLEEVAATQPRGKRIDVMSCTELPEGYLEENSVSIFGGRLPGGAGQYGENGTNLVPHHQRAGDEVLILPYFDNPWSKGQAIAGFYLADEPARLVEVLRQEMDGNWNKFFWPNWAYEFHAANGDRVYGSFADTTWSFDEAAEVSMKSPSHPVYEQEGLKIFAYDGAISNDHIKLVSSSFNKISEITGKSDFPEVRLYPNLERIGMRTGKMRPLQYNTEKHILHVVPSFLSEDDLLLDFATWHPFLARTQVQSEDVKAMIAGVQHRFAEQIGSERYGARLAEALRVESTGILSRPEQEDPSDFLLEAKARVRAVREGRPRVGRPERYPIPSGRLAGMTFAHQGYRVHNGYGGEKIKPSLDSLGELNVNALAIVPYTFLRNPTEPKPFFIPSDAGQENDWATAYSAREAHKKDWYVLLKPQIWIGGGHWPGDVDFTSEEDWEAFFEYYTYWILHYAVLAEREHIDGLCLGTELVKTTVKHPDRWREVIRKVRSVYGGQLTYAANWGEEFENFAFWDDLDAIGLNSYYPLSDKEAPSDEELLEGARRWLAMAAEHSRKVDRPLWLTEVGYRSVQAAWQHPHAEADERAASMEDQARCYDALLTAAAETPELRGSFFWKWPTYIGHGQDRNDNRYFTPGGKPAAQRLARFYGDWKQIR